MNKLPFVLWSVTLVALLYAGGTRPQQAEVQSLQSEINSLKSDVNHLKSKTSELDGKVSDLSSSRDQARSKLDEIASKLSDSIQRSDFDRLRSDLDTAVNDLRNLRNQDIEPITSKQSSLAGTLRKLSGEQTELTHSLDSIKEAQTLHASRLEQLKARTHLPVWHP